MLFQNKSFKKRKDFLYNTSVLNTVDLNNIQKNVFVNFLQRNIFFLKRKPFGLEKILNKFFPLSLTINKVKYKIALDHYFFATSFLNSNQYKILDKSFSLPLILKLSITPSTIKNKDIISPKESVYISLGEIPFLTRKGTFIINGIERTILNQLERASTLSFIESTSTKDFRGFKLIPYKGSWLFFYKDKKNNLKLRVNKIPSKKKEYKKDISIVSFLKLLNIKNETILKFFFIKKHYRKHATKNIWVPYVNLLDLKNKTFVQKDRILGNNSSVVDINYIKTLYSFKINLKCYKSQDFIGQVNFKNINKDLFSGKIITKEDHDLFIFNKIDKVDILTLPKNEWQIKFLKDFLLDSSSHEEVKEQIQQQFFNNTNNISFLKLFTSSDYYNLSYLGRNKLNIRYGLSSNKVSLSKEDFLYLINDLYHQLCGNVYDKELDIVSRTLRPLDSILTDLISFSLSRIRKLILSKETSVKKLNTYDGNVKLLLRKVLDRNYFDLIQKNFFNTSPLSQVIDQMNPLAELTHKRRVTLLGPGGLSVETATLENRDIHRRDYSKICPIETPEGANVGLVNTLSMYAKLDKMRLLQAPYIQIKNGNLTNKVVYLNSFEERNEYIALKVKSFFTSDYKSLIFCRYKDSYLMKNRKEISYCDVSPKQILSVSSGMIPFLDHNDASRALMGANMQRQAVSILSPDASIVGTGVESSVAFNSDLVSLKSYFTGVVENISSERLIIRKIDQNKSQASYFNNKIKKLNASMPLVKVNKSNQYSFNKQKPLVEVRDILEKNSLVSESNLNNNNSLSLGNNLLVAFMSYSGHTYEDSIIVSENIIKRQQLLSYHLESYEFIEKKNLNNREIFTKNIPGVSPSKVSQLDDFGIVKVGTVLKKGDILLGKIKVISNIIETQSTEVRFLEAIFKSNLRNKNIDQIIDISETYKKDQYGLVLDVQYFYNKDSFTSKVYKSYLNSHEQILKYSKILNHLMFYSKVLFYKNLTENSIYNNISSLGISEVQYKPVITQLLTSSLVEILILKEQVNHILSDNRAIKNDVLQRVKILVGWKHFIKPGDKLTGRHGNKGIISKVLKQEDMPYFEDGTPVDVVLNPLGITSRMNLGQIYETHLSWSSYSLGRKLKKLMHVKSYDRSYRDIKSILQNIYSYSGDHHFIQNMNENELFNFAKTLINGIPIKALAFEGANISDVDLLLSMSKLSTNGQYTLYDGKTGTKFDRKVTVGYMYMLKLYHFIDEKLHARSIGPYALLTQQPLRGKARMGGQRFGEMEVWALQGYGAAYTLQEMITVKSDSIQGRSNVHTSFRGDSINMGIPECFYVLIRELWALGLYIKGTKSSKNIL